MNKKLRNMRLRTISLNLCSKHKALLSHTPNTKIYGHLISRIRCFTTSGTGAVGAEQSINNYHNDPANLKTLRMVQMIFRHGARTPIFLYPNDPNINFNYGVQGMGQLTPHGRKQALELGGYLRNRYSGFLLDSYAPDELYVQCSDRDRTIMTAQLCLAGLYPPTSNQSVKLNVGGKDLNWEPVPIRTIPKIFDNKISGDWKCPHQEELYQEYLNRPEIQKQDQQNSELYKYISQHSGLNVTNYKEVYELVDTLNVQKENGAPLPEWTQKVHPHLTSEVANIEFKIFTWNDESKRLRMGPILNEMFKTIQVKIGADQWNEELDSNPLPDCKMYLYSGHDTTISGFLNTFDLYDGESPEYASVVIIELHEQEGKYYFKFFYKKRKAQQILDITLPLCPNPCPVSEFKKNYRKYLLTEDEWDRELAIFKNPI